ncbi:MAG TPA: RidA family protein [Aestuariivirga sp.]|jgi:enamine deaminase RidA (YjgF/YER057c/UK114 family)|nr:RidA family protein [Hyphomicrobiales bacterium]MBP9174258.1 RidA family protein [Hyphomicrobiales bacterium]MBZ0262052.1 RidA family protein [Hyphomicrobiales bacterium]HQY73566.1 RidA family protein [Aestuariivirga sp.]
MGLIDKRLAELGIVLPTPAKPIANYVPWVRTGNLVYISGQGAMKDGKLEYTGRVGDTLSIDDAIASARLTAINIIAHVRDACGGDLDRVKRVVKLLGLVNCTPAFGDHPKVINGASDLMVEVFGDKGRHARSAVGAPSLPFGLSVEVEAIVEIE